MAVEGRSLSPVQGLPMHWRQPLAALVVGLVALFTVFHQAYWSMVETWTRSETFAHGFLIVPIVLFLIWRQRHALADLQPTPYPLAASVLAALGFAWLLGELVDVLSVRQFAVMLMIPAVVWLLLGTRVVLQLKFPLAYLLFAVPFGEFLVQPLMIYTADFTVAMVRLTGIPVYRDGMYFDLPTGRWAVVEACSGIRYLIASVALGAIYAYMTYRTWFRRIAFMVAAVIVPIVANGLRAYMIVMIGHLSGMELAVGVDHLLYGWVFFGVVIFLMFWIGSFWRQDGHTANTAPESTPGHRPSQSALAVSLALAVAVIVAMPAYAAWMDRGAWPAPDLGQVPAAINGWDRTNTDDLWRPDYHNARDEWHAAFERDGQRVGLYVGFYAEQTRYGKMAAWENTLAGRRNSDWRQRNAGSAHEDARRALLSGPDTQLVVWQWYWVDGRLTTSRHLVKGLEAVSRLLGGTDDAANIVVFAEYQGRPAEAEEAMAPFADAMLPEVRERLRETGER